MKLSLSRAQELLATTTHDPHLLLHAANVRGCMEAFARHFGQPPEEVEHWYGVAFERTIPLLASRLANA